MLGCPQSLRDLLQARRAGRHRRPRRHPGRSREHRHHRAAGDRGAHRECVPLRERLPEGH